MNREQYFKNLETPDHPVDVVLDTDTYNEVDDQFALSYLIKNEDKLHLRAILAAPFKNDKAKTPEIGMEKSYEEIMHLLTLMKRDDLKSAVYEGSTVFMADEQTYVDSPAARKLVELAQNYSPENPLYVIAIAAITNISSAILMDKSICDKMVVIWLGGHGHHLVKTDEFNMMQDVAGARVLFTSGVPVVQLPCKGIVDQFRISEAEIEKYLLGKNDLCDYLGSFVIENMTQYAGQPWARVIWDVTAVAWLLNDQKNHFMNDCLKHAPLPQYDNNYSFPENMPFIRYVYEIRRNNLMNDLIKKLTS